MQSQTKKIQHAYISGIANKYAICRKKTPIHNTNKWKNIINLHNSFWWLTTNNQSIIEKYIFRVHKLKASLPLGYQCSSAQLYKSMIFLSTCQHFCSMWKSVLKIRTQWQILEEWQILVIITLRYRDGCGILKVSKPL